jgi:hypothetical protein
MSQPKNSVFPSLNIRRPFPLNEPVVLEFTPTSAGAIASFTARTGCAARWSFSNN